MDGSWGMADCVLLEKSEKGAFWKYFRDDSSFSKLPKNGKKGTYFQLCGSAWNYLKQSNVWIFGTKNLTLALCDMEKRYEAM